MAASKKSGVRCRIAPSPTGNLHLGTARTALFNWLFAKSQGGKFILRIEDTDLERSDKKFEKDIIDNLKWLGLEWDEGPDTGGEYGPYKQTERLKTYEKYLDQLLKEKKAYYCFCSKEELEAERQAQLTQGLPPKYSGRCRNLPEEESAGKRKTQSSVIRFLMPDTEVVFNDLIRGEVKFNSSLFGDIVIAKDTKTPLYNFAVVVDDETMKISHVIRGEDHIPNTPKQILMQKALGFKQPEYAHLPLILDPDRKKMSKRYSATTVQEYRDAGYLPEAMINFLSLLGWHPEKDREFLTTAELIKEFSLERIQKGGAIFNQDKLDWLNSQHLKYLPKNKIMEHLNPFIEKLGWSKDVDLIGSVIELEKDRIKKLSDFDSMFGFFFELPDYSGERLVWKDSNEEDAKTKLILIKKIIEETQEKNWSEILEEKLENLMRDKKGPWLWPLRVALSGQKASPGPFEIMQVLSKKEVLARINQAILKLK